MLHSISSERSGAPCGRQVLPTCRRQALLKGTYRMQYVLAVDGGNTKTIALVAALDGTILGAGRGGCGDIYNAGDYTNGLDSATAALSNIESAVTNALQSANVKASDLVTSVFSMAGADW